MSALNFDANAVAPDSGLSPVPKGRYKVMMIESELKPTKNGAGEIIAIKNQIIDGPFKGKTILSNLNYKNQNATAQNIGHAQLSAICHATGVLTPQDTQQLHNIPFGIEVDVTPDGKYNDVKAYVSADSIDAAQAVQTTQVNPIGMPPVAAAPPAQPQSFTPAPQAQAEAPVQTPAQPAQPTQPVMTASPSDAPVAPVEAAPTTVAPPWIVAQQAAAAAVAPTQ